MELDRRIKAVLNALVELVGDESLTTEQVTEALEGVLDDVKDRLSALREEMRKQ